MGKQAILGYLATHTDQAYTRRGLAKRLEIKGSAIGLFYRDLARLEKTGEVVCTPAGRYKIATGGKVSKASSRGRSKVRKSADRDGGGGKIVEGKLQVNRYGNGFVLLEGEDMFVPANELLGAVSGDLVQGKIGRHRARGPAGKLLKIIKRRSPQLVGKVVQVPGGFELELLKMIAERPVRLRGRSVKPEHVGALVSAQVVDWGTQKGPITAEVDAWIGSPNDPAIDMQIVLKQHDLVIDFPENVLEDAQKSRTNNVLKPDKQRRDLRHLTTFTIDPATAEDFDDAISLERVNGHWSLGVHIADVSFYVKQGSELDREAFNRGNSVYFTEGVVPMLPHLLSGDLCSLKPDEDRPTMSAFISLDDAGQVLDVEFTRGLIRSRRRFSYREAQGVIDQGKGEWGTLLTSLKSLTDKLQKHRFANGSVDFDIPEPIFQLGKDGVPHLVKPSERLAVHRIVEECMLLANRLVAERIPAGTTRMPFIYRVHDEPKGEQITSLSNLLKRLKFPGLPEGKVTSAQVRDLLQSMEDSPYRELIEGLTLRSMAKAIYSTNNPGHFGLAFKHYTHFTSPIRRYSDLAVHRIMVDRLTKSGSPWPVNEGYLSKVSSQCTAREAESVKAERDYRRIKELRYLANRINETYRGRISGVVAGGLYVQLSDSLVEGFVSIESMYDDKYEFVDDLYALRGRFQRNLYQLGQEIDIKVHDVSIEKRFAHFHLID
ncbi:ribonuclease R family protein [Candidatus Neomarinimicrobiota bacterium]